MLLCAAPSPGVMPRPYRYLSSLPMYFRLGLPLLTNKPLPPLPATSPFSTHTRRRALKPRDDRAACHIHTLDDDVLLLIFCTFPAKTVESLHHVLALSHVCRRWRQLCIHTPLLWRNYALVPPKALGGRERIEFNRELLRRTGREGLIGGWENEEWVGMTPQTPLLFRSLTNYTHHLHSLCVQLRQGDSGALEIFREYPFPLLRSLSLISPQHEPTLLLDEHTLTEDLPSLSRLVLKGVWFDIRKLKIGPNFDTLVMHVERHRMIHGDIDTRPQSFKKCVGIVAKFPQLRRWELDLLYLSNSQFRRSRTLLSDVPTPHKVTLTKLTSLDLKLCHMKDLEFLVKHVSLPSCRRLHVDILGAEGVEEQRSLTEAFVRNHTDSLILNYSELTVYNAGGSGFGFALSRDARVRAGEGLLSRVDPAALALKAADISLVFSQDLSQCVPEEYTAFLAPLKPIAKAVPTIIIFDGAGSQTTPGKFKMQAADYASTRELIHLGYTEGTVRNLVGYRKLLEGILRSKPRAAIEGRQVLWKCASPVFWNLRMIPVMLTCMSPRSSFT